ncbi:MAG: hypothetical protein WCR45_02755 [Bacteroidaceae bacterium]
MKKPSLEQKVVVDVEDKELAELNESPTAPNIYKLSRFQRIPFWVKAVLIKYWSFGMIYYFIIAGLGIYLIKYDVSLSFLIMGIVMGLVNDIVVNNILEVIDDENHHAHWYWIFKSKKVYSLLINIVYGVIWGVISGIFSAFLASVIPNNTIGLFQEPFTFALVGSLVEAFFVGIKDLIVYKHQK